MTNKPSDNDERYKTLGFESSFDGSAGGVQWSELVEKLKTNLLRQDLRVRKFIMGEYTTKVGDKDLAKVPTPLPDDWDATVKRQVSLALQSERKDDLIHKGKSASEIEKDTTTGLFKSFDYQIVKLKDDKERAYEFWYAISGGEVRSKVEQRGVTNVNDIFGELQTDYGQATVRDLKRLTNVFQSGKPEGCTELPEYLDVPSYLEEMSTLQEKLKQKTEASARETSAVLKEKAWTEAVASALPTIYEKCVAECRKSLWLADVMGMDDAELRRAEFVKGEKAYSKQELSKKLLREALVAEYDQNVRIWRERNTYKKVVTSLFATSVRARVEKKRDPRSGLCWGCNEPGHQLRDCPKKSDGGGRGGGSKPSAFKKTRTKREKAIAQRQSRSEKKDTPCHFWLAGECRNGKRCDFSHELRRGSGSAKVDPRVRLKDARIAKFVNRAQTFFTQGKRDAKSDSDDDTDSGASKDKGSKPDKKKLKSMLTQLANTELASLFMVKVKKNSDYEMTIPEGVGGDDTNVTETADAGTDTSAGVTPLAGVGSGTNDIGGITAPNVGSGTENVGAGAGVALDRDSQGRASRPTVGGLTIRVVSKESIQGVYDNLVGTAQMKGDTFIVNPEDSLEEADDSDGGSEAKVPDVNETHCDVREKPEPKRTVIPGYFTEEDSEDNLSEDDDEEEDPPRPAKKVRFGDGQSCKEAGNKGGGSKDGDPDLDPPSGGSGKPPNVGSGVGKANKVCGGNNNGSEKSVTPAGKGCVAQLEGAVDSLSLVGGEVSPVAGEMEMLAFNLTLTKGEACGDADEGAVDPDQDNDPLWGPQNPNPLQVVSDDDDDDEEYNAFMRDHGGVGGIVHPQEKPEYESLVNPPANALGLPANVSGALSKYAALQSEAASQSLVQMKASLKQLETSLVQVLGESGDGEVEKLTEQHQDTEPGSKVKIFMIGDLKQVGKPYSKVKMQASVFKTGTLGADETAWDYCAAASVCDVTSRFLWLDTSEEAKTSVEIVTTTGSGGCEGRGPLVHYLLDSKSHGAFVVIDCEGICSAKTENSPIAVTSALIMEKLGLVMQVGEPVRGDDGQWATEKFLRCMWTDYTVPLEERNGILILKTVPKSAKNLKNNKALIQYLSLLKEGAVSPLVNLWELDHRIQKGYEAQRSMTGRTNGVPNTYMKSPVFGWSGNPGGKRIGVDPTKPTFVTGLANGGWKTFPDDWQVDKALGNHAGWEKALAEEQVPWPGSQLDPMDVGQSSKTAATLDDQSRLPTVEESADSYLAVHNGQQMNVADSVPLGEFFNNPPVGRARVRFEGEKGSNPPEPKKARYRFATGSKSGVTGSEPLNAREVRTADFDSAGAFASGVGTGKADASCAKPRAVAAEVESGVSTNDHRFENKADLWDGRAYTLDKDKKVTWKSKRLPAKDFELVDSKVLLTGVDKGSVTDKNMKRLSIFTTSTKLPPSHPVDYNVVDYGFSDHEENEFLKLLQDRGRKPNYRSVKGSAKILLVNLSKLSAVEQARLWHWRLGHVSPEIPVKLSKKDANGVPLAHGINVSHCLNEDCIVCNKARFRNKPFRPVPPALRIKLPPYHTCYVDGFGGQRSMGTTSIRLPTDWTDTPTVGGAVGGYAFYDAGGGSIVPLLYKYKSQFPALCRRFILAVLAKGFRIAVIVATDTEIVNNKQVEVMFAEFDIQLNPPAVGSPADMGFAEKAIGDLMRSARSIMLAAPHFKPQMWGAAVVWAGILNEVMPKAFNDGITPYENATMRPPNLKRLCIWVFGCPCEVNFRPTGQRPENKFDERTETASFVGTEGGTKILVYVDSASRIYSASRRKVVPQEGAYIKGNPTTIEALKQRLQIVPDEQDSKQELIDTVPTIRAFATPSSVESGVEGSGPTSKDYEPYLEPHQYVIDTREESQTDKLVKSIIEKMKEPHVKSQLFEAFQPNVPAKYGARHEVAEVETIGDRASRRRKLQEAKETRELEEKKRAEQAAIKEAGAEREKQFERLLGPLHRAKPGTRVKIKTTRFDGEGKPGEKLYSEGKAEFTYGTVNSKASKGLISVLWDGDTRTIKSNWRHLERVLPTDVGATPAAMTAYTKVLSTKVHVHQPGYYRNVAKALGVPNTEEPLRTLNNIERAVSLVVLKTMVSAMKSDCPRDFADMLVLQPDWRKWYGAIVKENDSWIENGAVEEVDRSVRAAGEALIRFGELFSRKRNGTPKFRPYLRGDLLRAGIDFVRTFSGTVAAHTIKWFVSVMTGLRRLIKSADVMTGYLAGDQNTNVFCEKPSYWEYIDWPIESLAELRKFMKTVLKKHGMKAVRKLLRDGQNRDKILKVLRPIYGLPSAGAEFGMLVIYVMTKLLMMQRSEVDPAVYYKTDGQLACQHGPYANGVERYTVDQEAVDGLLEQGEEVLMPYRRDSCWTKSYIIVLTWTDDFPYAGTDQLVRWYEQNVALHLPLTFEPVCEDFVSIEIKQDLERGLKYMVHSKYCLAMGEKYREYLAGRRVLKVPMKIVVEKALLDLKPTDEEHAEVVNFPYRELVGTIAFPTCHTKIECKCAVAVLSRFLHNWTRTCIEAALDLVTYMVYSHDLGIVYSYGLDPHGINTVYGYTDSTLTPPVSMGANNAKMNGGCIAANAKKHTMTDTSTTMAEIVEAFNASQSLVGLRNLHNEMGITVNAPTKLYCDCKPVIQVVNGDRTMTESTRALDLKVWKLRERVDVQEVAVAWCSTVDEQSDLNTKALPTKQFRYLRDNLNGYGLVMLHYPDVPMPEAAIERDELIEMIQEYDNADDERAKKRAKASKL